MDGISITREHAEQRFKASQERNHFGTGLVYTMRSLKLKEFFFTTAFYRDWDKAAELGFVGSSTGLPYRIVPRPHPNRELELGLVTTLEGLIALHYEDCTLIDPRAKYGWA